MMDKPKDTLQQFLETRHVNQNELEQAIREGRISQAEVDHIWRETEFLSPQTPIEVRRVVMSIKEAGENITLAQQITLQAVLDLRAALYRDESKFAHLVSGTETIVGALQEVNKLALIVEKLETRLDETNMLVQRMIDLRGAGGLSLWQRLKRFIGFSRLPDEEAPCQQVSSPAQPEVEEDYDRMIGSHWDADNPRKK